MEDTMQATMIVFWESKMPLFVNVTCFCYNNRLCRKSLHFPVTQWATVLYDKLKNKTVTSCCRTVMWGLRDSFTEQTEDTCLPKQMLKNIHANIFPGDVAVAWITSGMKWEYSCCNLFTRQDRKLAIHLHPDGLETAGSSHLKLSKGLLCFCTGHPVVLVPCGFTTITFTTPTAQVGKLQLGTQVHRVAAGLSPFELFNKCNLFKD